MEEKTVPPPARPSALSSPPWWYKRLAVTPGVNMGADQSAFGLYPLLEQLQLNELREIARQRGWQVKGVRKTDYLAALAPLMQDPTEVARAVTSLPDTLREAVRAALVVEEGSGITPETLALTITALRGGQAPPFKPVEAAGLLLDLAHWGLLIPQRDSLTNVVRYLLPWEIQKQMPPLPGWCPQSLQTPGTAVLARDKASFMQVLYAVWEHISRQPQRVRPPVPVSAEPRPRGALHGWPSNPQEMQGRRRGDGRFGALSVPPPAFLLDDSGVSALAALTDGNAEQLEFICQLLCQLDLVSSEQGYLLARPEVMNRFLRLSTAEQHALCVLAYASLSDWNELDVMLRTDPRLVLWHDPVYTLHYQDFRSQLLHLHHMLLRFLAMAGEDSWCSFDDATRALRPLWPEFFSPSLSDRRRWPSQIWWLAWHADQRTPNAQAPRHTTAEWDTAQGSFMRVMVEGPLYWLGLAELRYVDARLTAFRLRGLADRVWDRPLATIEEQSIEQAVLVDSASLTVTVQSNAVPSQVHTFLGRIAHLEKSTPGRFVYRLDLRTMYDAFERGESLGELFAAWQEIMPIPMPEALQQTCRTWWERYGQVRLYEGLALLEVSDDFILRELEASTSLSQHLIARLSPRLALIHDHAVDILLQEFIAKGHTPKEAR